VEALVDGAPVWFETASPGLIPSLEGLATAFRIPALHEARALRVAGALCERWLEGQMRVAEIARDWWGYEPQPVMSERAAPSLGAPGRGTGLCFTGGVDSFHSLLRSESSPSLLVFCHGFDVPLADRRRMESIDATLHAVGQELSVETVVVRTNLREHPTFCRVHWHRSHGGALAALGHLLSSRIQQIVIPSSFSYDLPQPWGSSWLLDPLWSSSRLRVLHEGASLWRAEKLRRIAGHPLVAHHLRVCWENRAPTGNCSRCEKCVRTMLILAQCGMLDRFVVFDRSASLVDRIRGQGPMPPYQIGVYEEIVRRGLDRRLANAVVGWIRRSGDGRGPQPQTAGLRSRHGLARSS
jgi:hypothetical protein